MILVTGGRGFIGTALLREIEGKSYDLKDDDDILYLEDLPPAEDIETIIHLAASAGVPQSIKDPSESFVNNTTGTQAVLEHAREVGVNRIIFASSAAASNPTSPYGASKAAGEAYMHAYRESYGIETVCLRFSNVYGPGSEEKSSVVANMIKSALSGGVINIHGDGTQTRDFIYIDDIVSAIKECINYPVIGTLNIGTGIITSINDVATEIANQTGARIEHDRSINPGVHGTYTPMHQTHSKIKWAHKVNIWDGIKKTVESFK